MKDVIKLQSRDGTDNRLVKVGERMYELKTPYCCRAGFVSENKAFIDPSGGPMIVEGEYLPEADAVVDSIDKDIITFK